MTFSWRCTRFPDGNAYLSDGATDVTAGACVLVIWVAEYSRVYWSQTVFCIWATILVITAGGITWVSWNYADFGQGATYFPFATGFSVQARHVCRGQAVFRIWAAVLCTIALSVS